LEGGWLTTFVITSVTALYLNVFVLVVQLFAKTPPLAKLAPTQQEAPFALTQGLILVLFIWLGWTALKGQRRLATASPALRAAH
jgi:phosphate starvation-inducible membrane PsiE